MLDGNKCFFPIEKDTSGNLRMPQSLNCSPVHSIHAAIISTNIDYSSPRGQSYSRYSCAVVAFAVRRNSLMQRIIELDVTKVKSLLETAEPEALEKLLRECSDGNRNIFHICAAMCAPRPKKDFAKNLQSLKPDLGAFTDVILLLIQFIA